MRNWWCLILLLGLWSPTFAADEIIVPFEDMHCMSPLPDYVYAMPRRVYEKWVVLQNQGAVRNAQRVADAWNQRNPYKETYVQSSKYKARVTQTQSEHVTRNSASMQGKQDTDYDGKDIQMNYRSALHTGGPVLVLNPYTDRPAKVIVKDDGTIYVADPDKTLKPGEAEALIEKAVTGDE